MRFRRIRVTKKPDVWLVKIPIAESAQDISKISGGPLERLLGAFNLGVERHIRQQALRHMRVGETLESFQAKVDKFDVCPVTRPAQIEMLIKRGEEMTAEALRDAAEALNRMAEEKEKGGA